MISMITKASGLFQMVSLPLFMMTSIKSVNNLEDIKEEQGFDDVPGDNFPYIVMTSKFPYKY